MSSDNSDVARYYKGFGYVAATLGMIQGIAWIILAIMAILLHTEAWTPINSSTGYSQLLGNKILERFFIGARPENVYVGPREFFMYCIVHLIVSLIWTGISLLQFWVIFREKYLLLKNVYLSWGSSLILLCLYELVWAGFFARDYDQVVQEINQKENVAVNDYFTISAHGTVMTLVARGFVLWCVNLVVAISILRITTIITKKVSEIESDQDLINAFEVRPNSWKSDLRSSLTSRRKSFSTFRGLPRIAPVQSTNEILVQHSETKANGTSVRKSDNFNYLVGVSSADIHQRPISPPNGFLKNRSIK